MAYGYQNGHVTDDVIPIRLEHNISQTAGDAIWQQSLNGAS